MLVCQRPFGGGLDLVDGSKKTMIYGISPIYIGDCVGYMYVMYVRCFLVGYMVMGQYLGT